MLHISPSTPAGRPLTVTNAVSLVDEMLIDTMTWIPFLGTTTVEMGSETLIGTCAIMDPPPAPHPAVAEAKTKKCQVRNLTRRHKRALRSRRQ